MHKILMNSTKQEYIKTVENAKNEFEKESKFLKEENTKITKCNILQKNSGAKNEN